MNNPHLIVGKSQRCLCGTYGGEVVHCSGLIQTIQCLKDTIPLCRDGVDVRLPLKAVLTLCAVLSTLIEDFET